MLERGYSATTVDDICKLAGVAKGGYFHHFASKEMMAREVLEHFIEGLFAVMSLARDPQLETDPLKRLRRMFHHLAFAYESMESGPGCLIGMLAMELGAKDKQFADTCNKAFGTMRTAIESELEAAIELHSAPQQDTTAMAQGAVATFQGAAILARAKNDRGVIRETLNNYANLLENLILRSED